MSVTFIKRIDGATNNLVYMEVSNTLAQATTAGYVAAQQANIDALNDGAWTWETNDAIMLSASDGIAWCSIDATFANLTVFSALTVNAVTFTPPSIANHLAVFTNTAGNLSQDVATAINQGNLQAGLDAHAGTLISYPGTTLSGHLIVAAVNNSGGNFNTTISNAASVGQSQVVSIPDSGASTANFLLSKTTGTQHVTVGSLQVDAGNVSAGLAAGGTAGTFVSYSATGSKGALILAGVANTGNTNTTISNAAMGQASVISIPDPGAATANFVLDAGTNVSGTFTTLNAVNLKYGATPVAQVDPGSCTITAAPGAANHCTITIQLKDGSATNMTRVIPFKVYLATDNTGLVLQSAASTGYSVTSGGVVDPTGSTTITQGLAAFSSATGGCVVDLLDTGKGTGNLILMLPNGFKASAAITSGSYG